MKKIETDVQLQFLKTCQPNSCSKFIFVLCNISHNDWGDIVFDAKL